MPARGTRGMNKPALRRRPMATTPPDGETDRFQPGHFSLCAPSTSLSCIVTPRSCTNTISTFIRVHKHTQIRRRTSTLWAWEQYFFQLPFRRPFIYYTFITLSLFFSFYLSNSVYCFRISFGLGLKFSVFSSGLWFFGFGWCWWCAGFFTFTLLLTGALLLRVLFFFVLHCFLKGAGWAGRLFIRRDRRTF